MKSKILIIFFAIVSVVIVFNEDKQDHNQFSLDTCGYYLYLPALFIYHDIGDFDFYPAINNKYHSGYLLNSPLPNRAERKLEKYPLGVCFFELPFFLLAHAYCIITHQYIADGFSMPYQLAGIFSNILVVLLGLFVLRQFLKKYYNDNIVAITLLCIAFGTNLYAYTVFLVGMSHPYSFFLFACLIVLSEKWYSNPKNKLSGIFLGLVMAFIFMVRPINIVSYIIPLFWKVYNWQSLKKRIAFFAFHFKAIIPILFFYLLAVSIQFTYWKYITGHWLYYSYQGEGFNFLHPNIINGLFSYRKGWFVYTPMALAGLSGFYFLWKKDKKMVPALLVFFIIMVYAVFSWREWWYGGGFGCRPLVESYAVMALFLAPMVEYFYNAINKVVKTTLFAVISMVVILNIFQSYQFCIGLIHWSRMTKTYYWKVFGRGDFGKEKFDRVKNEQYLIPIGEESNYNN